MAGISEDEQINLLFKKFTNTVNANPELPFSDTQNRRFPFQNFEFSKNLFIDDIPDNLDNITYNGLLGSAALDASFGVATDISYEIPNYPLLYYHRIELTNALDTLNNTSWYYPDPNNNKLSLLRGSIPFNYDPINFTYKQLLYSNSDQEEALNSDPLYWLFDYKSGFVQFYGDQEAVTNWVNTNGPPRISVIVYNGNKGLENFSGGGGGSSTIDISGNISVNNLFMNLTQDTSINYNARLKKTFSSTPGNYGQSVSLSGNGNILIVSAPERSSNDLNLNGEIIVYENLNSTWKPRDIIYGLDGEVVGRKTAINYDGTVIAFSNPEQNSYTGFVKIYKYINSEWIQIGTTLIGSNTSDHFGNSLALNNDGTVLAIGSPYYNSVGNYEGKVDIYEISNTTVSEQLEIFGPSATNSSGFGENIALSLDGNILAVGTPYADSDGTSKGEVNIYNITSGSSSDIGRIVGELNHDAFGGSISLNFDGYKILIGAPNSDSQGLNTGSVYLYEYNSETSEWSKKGDTLYGESAQNFFGISSCINSDGSIIVVGAAKQYSNNDGYVKVYKVNNTIELLYTLTDSNYPNNNGDYFGFSNSLSNNGKTLVIGSWGINTNYIYNLYNYVYNNGEINFVANDENISKIKSTYDEIDSSINFSVLNNNILEDRVTINKEGMNISGNITTNGDLNVTGNLTVGGNITTTDGYFIGDGSQLTGITQDKIVSLTEGSNVTIAGTYPDFTISSSDTNTTYSAGTGMSLVGTTFNNTAPDQTVSLTEGSNVTITGNYPNFTISSSDTNTTYSAGTGVTLSGTRFSIGQSVGTSNSVAFSTIKSTSNSVFNYARIGDMGYGSNWTGFAHNSLSQPNNYAILQKNSGAVLLNSSTGENIGIRVGNVEYAKFDSTDNIIRCNGYGFNSTPGVTINQITPLIFFIQFNGIAYWWCRNSNNEGGLIQANNFAGTTFPSDDRLKYNETEFSNGIELVKQLRPTKYDQVNSVDDDESTGIPQYGFIADEVESIPGLDILVHERPDQHYPDNGETIKALHYNGVMTISVQALKEVIGIVETQQTEITRLNNLVTTLEGRINSLAQQIMV